MRVISSIEDPSGIRDILEHLGFWLVRACPGPDPGSRPPPKIHAPPAADDVMDDLSQLPIHDDHLYGDPQYSWDDYIQS